MKIKCNSTGNEFDLPLDECQRLYAENPFEFTVLDDKFVPPVTDKPSTIAQKVLGNVAGGDGEKGDGDAPADPYIKFEKKDFEAELTKRGIDLAGLTNNDKRKARLVQDDNEKKAQAEKEALALASFETLKEEAGVLDVIVDEADTFETLQEKVNEKKAQGQ